MLTYDQVPSVEEAEETLRKVEEAQKQKGNEGSGEGVHGGVSDDVSNYMYTVKVKFLLKLSKTC